MISWETDISRIGPACEVGRIADALKAIEWVDSGDSGVGDESAAIRRCITTSEILGAALIMAENARNSLEKEIAVARSLLAGKDDEVK